MVVGQMFALENYSLIYRVIDGGQFSKRGNQMKKTLTRFVVFLATLVLGALQPNMAQAAARAALTMTTGTVTVSGIVLYGNTLEATTTGWNAPNVTVKYQWLRNGVAIKNATSAAYRVGEDDLDVHDEWELPDVPVKNITVKVTVTAAGYKSGTATSAPVLATNGKPCTLVGTAYDDVFRGSTGKDIFCGFAGNDAFTYTKGPDFIDGGTGVDTLDMSDQTKNATVDLMQGTAKVNGGTTSNLASIENVITGRGADRVIGNELENDIRTFNPEFSWGGDPNSDGKDYVDGKGGIDRISTGPGDDTILGGEGDDGIMPGLGDDQVDGGAGNNYCDLPDSYDDSLVNCVEYDSAPNLISVDIPQNGDDIFEVVIENKVGNVERVDFNLVNGDQEINGELWSTRESRSGSRDTWIFGFPLSNTDTSEGDNFEGLRPMDHAGGEWLAKIIVTTSDYRVVEFRGKSDGSYDLFEYNYFSGSENGETTGNVSNRGSTSVILNRDVESPVITTVSLNHTSFDASSNEQIATASIVATDNLSTTLTATCHLVNFNSNLDLVVDTSSVTLTGSGECNFVIPKGTPTGSYGVWIEVKDEFGNQTRLIPASDHSYSRERGKAIFHDKVEVIPFVQTQGLSYSQDINLEFTETGLGDELAPDISQITWTPSIGSTRLGDLTVSANIQFAGIQGSASNLQCVMWAPHGSYFPIQGSAALVANSTSEYQVDFTIPKKSPKGKYTIQCLAKDAIGWKAMFIGSKDGTFTTTGVNNPNPTLNRGVPYFTVG